MLTFAAETALQLPVLESGFWFHHDLRDNFYYAMHLFAASQEDGLIPRAKRPEAAEKAIAMLLKALALQDRNPESDTYGHWPLDLSPDPAKAKPHTLPVELLGTLLAHFYETYGRAMPDELRTELSLSLLHVYQGNYYRKPLELCIHHEAKYVAQQLVWGRLFDDAALLAEGHRNLRAMLERIRREGMIEYGCLPWFWHWVQAFACAWELADRPDIRADLEAMLEFLWREREQAYLRGAWVGPHSRVLPHDAPADCNTLLDYIQFGDFPLPSSIARLEAAALINYEAPAAIRQAALDRSRATERKRLVPKRREPGHLHSYVYMSEHYAVGGMWEYVEEYLNEQQRWDVTIPADAGGSANQLYLFHPGKGYKDGDYRHQSRHCEVLLHKRAVAALYPLPENGAHVIAGCLPQGEWVQKERLLAGKIGRVYAAVHTMQPVAAEAREQLVAVKSEGRKNGVVVEVLSEEEAAAAGIGNLYAFAEAMERLRPVFAADGEGRMSVEYRGLQGEALVLRVSPCGAAERTIGGKPVDFADYRV